MYDLFKDIYYLHGVSAQGPAKVRYRLSGEFRFSPSAVRSCPNASDTKLGSDSAARINVKSPTIPNWFGIIVSGIFVTLPKTLHYIITLSQQKF